MQTNILGPRDAPYVNTLTSLDSLTKKEKAILLACIQQYYEASIQRLALALREPHGEDELAFLACVLTQFYHKAEIELPVMLLKVANMEIPIVDQTTNLILLFLLQINKGFRGVATDRITEAVNEAAKRKTGEVLKGLGTLSHSDNQHITLAVLADELSNHTSFTMAVEIYQKANDIKSNYQLIDFDKWENAKMFAEAYNVGVQIKELNEDLPITESEVLNQLHRISPGE